MIKIIVLAIFFLSCAAEYKNVNQIELIHKGWSNNSQVKYYLDNLGSDYEIQKNGDETQYIYKESHFPSLILFEKGSKVSTIFMSISEKDIDEAKRIINCQWIENKQKKQVKDLIIQYLDFKCLDKNILIKKDVHLNQYQIWWN